MGEQLPKITNVYLNAILMVLIPLVYGLGRAYYEGDLTGRADLVWCLWHYSEYTFWPLLLGWIGMDRSEAAKMWTEIIMNLKGKTN